MASSKQASSKQQGPSIRDRFMAALLAALADGSGIGSSWADHYGIAKLAPAKGKAGPQYHNRDAIAAACASSGIKLSALGFDLGYAIAKADPRCDLGKAQGCAPGCMRINARGRKALAAAAPAQRPE